MQTKVEFRMTVKGDFTADAARRLASILEANARNMTVAEVTVDVAGTSVEGDEKVEKSPGVKPPAKTEKVDGPLPDRSQKSPVEKLADAQAKSADKKESK